MVADPKLAPTKIKAPHGALIFEITWQDRVLHSLPHAILRGYCPCASCQGHHGGIRFVATSKLMLRDIKRVGNYALEFTFEDGHTGGIYSFAYLRRLGELYASYGDQLPERFPELPR